MRTNATIMLTSTGKYNRWSKSSSSCLKCLAPTATGKRAFYHIFYIPSNELLERGATVDRRKTDFVLPATQKSGKTLLKNNLLILETSKNHPEPVEG